MVWESGQQLCSGLYTIERELGRGGFGITYLARHVRLLDVFPEGDRYCLVMEYIEGVNLDQWVKQHGRLQETEAINYIRQIGSALQVVHGRKMLHRDVKPANIMLRRSDQQAVLIDFGIARQLSEETQMNTGVRSEGYAPPEQYEEANRPMPYIDVYALAATLYFLVTAEDPTPSQYRRLTELPDPKQLNHGLSDRTNEEIMKGLALNPKYRAQTVEKWLGLLPDPAAEGARKVEAARVAEDRKRREEADRQKREDERRIREAQQKWEREEAKRQKIHQVQPQSISLRSRRQILQWVGGLSGLGLAIRGGYWIVSRSGSSEKTFDFEVVTVNEIGEIISRTPAQTEGFIEDLGNGITLEMVKIPAGSFVMGSPETEENRDDNEGPQRMVTFDHPFWIGQYPITQAQWRTVASLPKIYLDLDPDPSGFKGDNLPVESITWYEAVEFCDRLSKYTGKEYRLPSEAEWEYSCRASTTTPFHFGETITADLANYNGNYTYRSGPKGVYQEKTTPVGSFRVANNFGLYDMHGNVLEWCADLYRENYKNAPIDGTTWEDISDNNFRVARGGSWFGRVWYCRSADRHGFNPVVTNYTFGFRVACSASRV